MAGETSFLVSLALAVLAAFVGGAVAQRLKQPTIVGYLFAGVVIGPFTPGPTVDTRTIQVLAEIGVAFLMFTLGAEFSLNELRRLGRVVTLGGALQMALTIGLGPLLAPLLGLSFVQGIFLGALLALSSTVVVMKILLGRGEAQALHGRVALGILIAQDLAVVPLVIVLPALALGGGNLLPDLGLATLKAVGVLAGAYLIGVRAVPWLLGRTTIARTRELFLLGIVGLALGTALVTQLAGLSLAFGAFLAGLVVAESDFRTRVVAEILPLRDMFTALFFVSVGMLVNPPALVARIDLVIPLVVAVILGKAILSTGVVLALGMPGRVALLSGLSLAQVGEFSFVIAGIGVSSGAIPPVLFDLTLTVALVTIVLTPALLETAPFLLRALERLPVVGARWAAPAEADAAVRGMRGHVVICGYGRVGRELADALERRRLTYAVVEYNPVIARELRARGVPVVFGDAGNPVVLEHANLHQAKLLAVLVPDANAVELVTRYARALKNPRLDIVARVETAGQIEQLRRIGATAVVQPEFEAGVEVIRHVLHRYGIDDRELAHVIAGRRAAFYRQATEG